MAPRVHPLLLLLLCTLAAPAWPGSGSEGDGGWQRRGPGVPAAVAEEERCTVERRAGLSYAEFVQHYAFSRPVILQGLTDNSRFRALCSRERLLASFGDSVVRLSTANTYSYQKVDLVFQEYVEQLLHPQDPTSLGNALHLTPIWSAGYHSCLQLWDRRNWLRGALPLARAWVLRSDLRTQALVPVSP
uniref:Jumonji domain containing 8 n=1 Tax=Molossus molossus TaxID=27622 RepID=A0A7J8J016_MOLMO|nr:jumonji domain containing 8 [Molossus molossus]